NNTNPISVVGPSSSNLSLTHGQSSLRDTYQPLDMVEREDIVYSDHENVGTEVDFNNLETFITNKEGDTAFDEKEHDTKKPESADNLSPSRSALSGEKDDTTKKKDKGKSPVEYFLEYRDLNAVFEDFSK
nr:hypothetical protein [Tanacetum cinerariifolium]